MQEPHDEGRASHTDSDSCVGRRKAVVEALTGGNTDEVLSCEVTNLVVPAPLCEAEGEIDSGVKGEPEPGAAQSENRHKHRRR